MRVNEAYDHWSQQYDNNRNLTRDLDQEVTQQVLKGYSFNRLLEIGCGTGKNTLFLKTIAQEMMAIDFSEGMLEKARQHPELKHVKFMQADLSQVWPVQDNSVDGVVCNLVLEHFKDLDFIFAQVARVLTSSGYFYISELHSFRQYQGTQARFNIDGEEVKVEAHLHHISEYLSIAKQFGFKLIEFNEWWHQEDQGKNPRLLTCLFQY